MNKQFIKIFIACTFLMCIFSLFTLPVFASNPRSKTEETTEEENKKNTTKGLEEKIKINKDDITDIPYSEYLEYVDKNEIESIYYGRNTPNFYIFLKNGKIFRTDNPDYDTFKKEMLERNIIIHPYSLIEFGTQMSEPATVTTKSNSLFDYVKMFAFILVISFILYYISKKMQEKNFYGPFKVKEEAIGPKAKVKDKESKEIDENIKYFSDIAGLKEVKKDVETLVDFLVNKEKYLEAGAHLPKGVILYGPPGTGKTLLAKAIAGEANTSFVYASGSEFVEMYVGVGAKRVRELFKKAKDQAPCIIFIDEIDSIGGKRQSSSDNGEDRKTINELLTQMDGFKETENILVIGATNRIEDLDPALLRPGRFTNKYCVPLPETAKERLEIINLYNKNKKFSEDVDFDALARETTGFSPAKIEALLNEAAIISVKNKMNYINKEILEEAMFKILLSGHVKEDQSGRDVEELKLVAWHEAGHAVVGYLNGKEINKVTILSSTSGAGGVTFSTPSKTHLLSADNLKDEVMELYGGRVAEYIYYGNKNMVTTGASNDIDRATDLIHDIVTNYGMTEDFGLLNLEKLKVNNKTILEKEVNLAKELEENTEKVLRTNYYYLSTIANMLLQNETIYKEDIERIFSVEV